MKSRLPLLLLLFPLPALAAEVDQGRAESFSLHLAQLETVRKDCITNATAMARHCNAVGAARWNDGIAAAFDDRQLGDFFAGAQTWIGAYDDEGAVGAWFNPWWDALLFFRTEKGSLPHSETETALDKNPEIAQLFFLSGETFRGKTNEVAETPPSVRTTLPGADEPLAVAVWRAQSVTLRRFDEAFPPNGDDGPRKKRLRDLEALAQADPGRETLRLQARSAVRLRMLSLLGKNKESFLVAGECVRTLRTGSAMALRHRFTSAVHNAFCRSLAKLPAPLRAGFDLSGYIPTEKGTLFVFVNKDMPRVFATVTFPAGRLSGGGAGDTAMEWYDLGQAADLLAAWESEKGGAK